MKNSYSILLYVDVMDLKCSIYCALMSWGIAQVLKVIINYCVTRELNWERLFGDGGMPSGHSATVSAMATMAFLTYGGGSFEFALAMMVAIIVTHDATGVRLETGKQAVIIKELMHSIEILTNKDLPEVKLKEFVGHTPFQVMAGITIGIINALAAYYFIF